MERKSNSIVKRLLLLGSFLQREANRLLAGYGLNQQQFVVLKEIHEKGPVSQKEICSALLFEKSNVSKIVNKLEESRFIRSVYDPEDTRVTILSVTKKGDTVVERCMERLNDWNSRWLDALSEKEITQIDNAVRKLSDIAG